MQEYLKIQLDFLHKIPLSDQVQNKLRELVQSGLLQSGDQLPTVRQLAAQLNINFNTVARAYRVLDEEGWISTQQGRGTYVLEASVRKRVQLNQGETSDQEIAPQEAISPTEILNLHEAAMPEGAAESNEVITSGDTPISIDRMVTKDNVDITARDASAESGVSNASNAISAAAMAAVQKVPEKAELQKEKVINEWIERLMNEAAQNNIAVEDLYLALGQRLVAIQASIRVSPRKAITRQPIKQNRKPRHLTQPAQEKQTPLINVLRRKKIQSRK